MTDITKLDDINVADLMPPADPALLASANRMLSGRLSRIAGALRATAIDGVDDIEDGKDPYPHINALIARHFDVVREAGKSSALIDILKRNFASKERECEALRKSLEAAHSHGDDRPVAGYTTADTMLVFQALDEARKQAESAVVSRDCRDQEITVYELRLIGTAKRAAEWVPA